MRPRSRGIILIIALMFCAILLIMLTAAMGASRGGLLVSQGHQARVAALYVAEAAVAHALAQLDLNPDWKTGFANVPMDGGKGSYTIQFHPTGVGTVGPDESVNNISGGAVLNGPRGTATVAQGTADLVILARVGLVTRRIEVLVARGTSGPLDAPLVASRKIALRGDMKVDGITSLSDPQPFAAGLHSNATVGSDLITWEPRDAGDAAEVAGTVSVGASSGINMPGATLLGAPPTKFNEAHRPLPSLDIPASVAGKSGSPPPSIAAVGTSTLGTGTPEDFYSAGPVNVNGDLVLNGATLYVEGDLTVNGSISGDGNLYVNGRTSLRGDARLVPNDDRKVTVYSKGSIELLGFDGDAYLDALAGSDPQFAIWHSEARTALQELQDIFRANGPGYLAVNEFTPAGAIREGFQAKLGSDVTSAAPRGGGDKNVLGKMATRILTQSDPGPTGRFLAQKLNNLSDTYKLGAEGGGDATVVAAFKSGGAVKGLMDGAGDMEDAEAMKGVMSVTMSVDYDHLGQSYFQGVLYTNGYVYASNEVNVVGAVLARDDGTQTGATVDGVALEPGDIMLANRSRLTFNKGFFDGSTTTAGPVGVITWIGR